MPVNFWKKLPRPIFALAPLAGFTDSAFRQICKKFGADVVYSEMASVTALFYSPEKTLELISFNKEEAPYVVQLFGSNPEHFKKAVEIIDKEIKPDGYDINFGCPVKKVLKQGAGSELMKNIPLAQEVIRSVVNNTSRPVSVKIRAASGKVDALKFLDAINSLGVSTVMIHGRTFSQGFIGEIDCQIIKKARNYFGGIILANGGMNSPADIKRILGESEADGVGLARGALSRPWIFDKDIYQRYADASSEEFYSALPASLIIETALEHSSLCERLKGREGIVELRKHLCWYAAGLPGARKLRESLVKAESFLEIRDIFSRFEIS